MRIIPLTDFPERFQAMQEVYVGDELLHIDSVQVKGTPQLIRMRFREYPVREQAARLTGRYLTVAREEAMPLQEGQYYTFDIVGLAVFDMDGKLLGRVAEVLQTGSNDVYAVEREGEKAQLLVPALKSVVKEINIAAGRMVVDMPEEI